MWYFRSSRREVICKKGALKCFGKFTGKHLCQCLFLNKVAGIAFKFIKKETLGRAFSWEFCKIFNPIQDGLFWDCSRKGGGVWAKRLKTVTHILQWWNFAVIPYLRKIQKMYKSRDTFTRSADISIFSPKISKNCYINKHTYRLDFDT